MLDAATVTAATISDHLKEHGAIYRSDFCSPSFNDQEILEHAARLLAENPKQLFRIRTRAGRNHSTTLELVPTVGMGAVKLCYTDREPYEVVRVISEQTLEIRPMKAVLDPKWKRDFTPGGFFGHTHNNGGEWILSSDPEAPTIRVRLSKSGDWVHKSEKFRVGRAYKWYDFNF